MICTDEYLILRLRRCLAAYSSGIGELVPARVARYLGHRGCQRNSSRPDSRCGDISSQLARLLPSPLTAYRTRNHFFILEIDPPLSESVPWTTTGLEHGTFKEAPKLVGFLQEANNSWPLSSNGHLLIQAVSCEHYVKNDFRPSSEGCCFCSRSTSAHKSFEAYQRRAIPRAIAWVSP